VPKIGISGEDGDENKSFEKDKKMFIV